MTYVQTVASTSIHSESVFHEIQPLIAFYYFADSNPYHYTNTLYTETVQFP